MRISPSLNNIEKGEKEGRSITDAMNDGEIEGMQTFDAVLERLIRGGQITKDVGLAYSSNANNLALSISDMAGEAKPEPEVVLEAEAVVDLEGFER